MLFRLRLVGLFLLPSASPEVLVAMCFSGQLRGADRRLGQLRDAKTGAAVLGRVRVFASVHVDRTESLSPVGTATLAAVVSALEPAAYEFYDSGAFACAERACPASNSGGGGGDGHQQHACTFLAQFTGVRRSFRLMLEDETRTGLTHALVVRFRFDVSCVNWASLPAAYPALLGSGAGRQLGRGSSGGGPGAAEAAGGYFLGASRATPRQQLSPFDWTDFAWVVTRAAAAAVFEAVEEHGPGGCGRLMRAPVLEAACAAAAGNGTRQCEAAGGGRGGGAKGWGGAAAAAESTPLTRCKFYECIVNVRLRRLHPTAVTPLSPGPL